MSTLRITKLRTTIVDLPTSRPHRFVNHEIYHQSYLLVEVHTDAGVIGIGEGVSPGGPWWSGESIEGQQQLIEVYLAPALVGMDCLALPLIRSAMDRVSHGNEFAKAAVEMALLDATGRVLGVPVHRLLGGAARTRIPVRWALSGSGEQEVADEAIERLGQGHPALKLKLGALPPDEDLKRAARLIAKIGTEHDYLVDPNGSWDYRTAVSCVQRLEAMGVSVVEQPIDRRDVAGMASLVERTGSLRIMADESVCRAVDAMSAVTARSCDSVSVKIGKAGGLRAAVEVATIASHGGLRCYGGTAIETSIGTAAAAHVFASVPELDMGCELIGPLLLRDDLTVAPVRYENGRLVVPEGPGLGVDLDRDKVDKYRRHRTASDG
ncbi:muconate/chloromuconate family cycloisomerase [Streptomyces sp. NBC_00316]|uniref:muconate/chloromuconate family cycloisomerase n=1 Tax=Streptomyces sp. NBC_00316 TaxID=2975710 RepID=UPI002E283380|nr:muconate/chloromuconate family cycloisomerase [Streptomyces sp. NBC_00316]